ncbi:hypothetical protein KKHLCK_05710 [Candidatus Electrothrix laxa]
MYLREGRFFFALILRYSVVYMGAYLPTSIINKYSRFIGKIAYIIDQLNGKKVAKNLKHLFPEKDTKQIQNLAKETIQQLCLADFENTLIEKLIAEGYYKKDNVVGLNNLNAALKKGKGIILVISHFGPHLQVIPALGFRGHTVNQVSNKLYESNNSQSKVGFFEKLYRSSSLKNNGRYLPVKMIKVGTYMRPLFDHLRNNEIVIAAIDGKTGGKTLYFKLLGCKSYPFSTGPFSLAYKTGAAIVPSFTVRGKDDSISIILEKEIVIDRNSTDKEAEIVKCTSSFVTLLEKYLTKFPDHCGRHFLGRQASVIFSQQKYDKQPVVDK